MSKNTATGSGDETQVPAVSMSVSPELRDKIRVAKARKGLTYDEYLRRQLDVSEDLDN